MSAPTPERPESPSVEAEAQRILEWLDQPSTHKRARLPGIVMALTVLRQRWQDAAREQGRREGLDQAAKLLEQPGFVFAFEREDIRAEVIRRIRALAKEETKG